MGVHEVRTFRETERLPRAEQLAWKIAEIAADRLEPDADVAAMAINRIVDNAAVAAASLNRRPVANARAQACARQGVRGAAVFGMPQTVRVHPEWAAWANGVAVRELDFHDTFLAADYSHPGDNIPPLLAVAQAMGRSGADLLRAIVTAYEVQVSLVKAICLHRHKIDHVAHLGPSVAAGLGTLLDLSPEITFQAVQHALHVTTATRQSRKGEISSWKAYAPAHAAKLAIEAVDRAMRGETAPSPIYEGEDGVIAWMLAGPEAVYRVSLPGRGEPKRAILETYTKAHSAEYQSQALIDLALRLGPRVDRAVAGDWDRVREVVVHTSHHTHYVIGSGANDPQKYDPTASRETLDHSIMYILAVALQDGEWRHVESYLPERAARPDTVRLWRKIQTVEDTDWTARYHAADPARKAFGGRVVITLDDGAVIEDELAVADAHPLGARPFARPDYVRKFSTLAGELVSREEQARFLALAERLPELAPAELVGLSFAAAPGALAVATGKGIL